MKKEIKKFIHDFPLQGNDINFLSSQNDKINTQSLILSINKSLSNKNIPFKSKEEIIFLSCQDFNLLSKAFKEFCLISQDSFKIQNTLIYKQLEYINSNIEIINEYYATFLDKLNNDIIFRIQLFFKNFSNTNNNPTPFKIDISQIKNLINKKYNERDSLYLITEQIYNYDKMLTHTYEKIKKEYLLNSSNLSMILKNLKIDKYVDLEIVKNTNHIAYELITKNGLNKYCENLGIKIDLDEGLYKEFIQPNSLIGQKYKLTDREAMFFAISLYPIENFNLKMNSKIINNGTLKFINNNDQVHIHDQISFFLEINGKPIIIKIPIFISYQKIELIKSQSKESIKIIN